LLFGTTCSSRKTQPDGSGFENFWEAWPYTGFGLRLALQYQKWLGIPNKLDDGGERHLHQTERHHANNSLP
jgi:hypothetical protein